MRTSHLMRQATQALFIQLAACVLPLRQNVRRIGPFCKIVAKDVQPNLHAVVTEDFAISILGKDDPSARVVSAKRYGPQAKGAAGKVQIGVPCIAFFKGVAKMLKREAGAKLNREALGDVVQTLWMALLHKDNLILPKCGAKGKDLLGGSHHLIVEHVIIQLAFINYFIYVSDCLCWFGVRSPCEGN